MMSTREQTRYREGGEQRCHACGAAPMILRFRVEGEVGEDGLIPTTDRFGVALSGIMRCERCGHMQLAHMPTEADLSDAYGEAESGDYVAEEAGQRATADLILKRIEQYHEPGRLVDLGCWVGYMLSQAERRGWSAFGVEPSEFASSYARDELGLDVQTGDLFDVDLGEGGFDAAFMGDVIEHIPAAGSALDRARSLLKPGGLLALALPDAGSRIARLMGRHWWSVIPTHVHYFTRQSIETLLDQHGFDLLEITSSPKVFTVGYYLSRLAGYQSGVARGLVGAAARMGIADRLWAPDFRDRMLVVVRAREG